MLFKDRHDAGKKLAGALFEYKNDANAIIIALPRGGVVVGYEVAKELNIPLDIVSPRKIGAPFNPELAIGAITETGIGIFNESLINELGISQKDIEMEIEREKKVALHRLKIYRRDQKKRELAQKKVIIVDDGLATGATMRAAIKTVKEEKASYIIVAVPVGPSDTVKKIEKEADKVIVLHTPPHFYAVGQFYHQFDQTGDDEVIELLNASHKI